MSARVITKEPMEIDQQIGKILYGYQQALALMTANNLGLFDEISGSYTSADHVAKNRNLSLKGTERLLNVLSGMGIVHKEHGQFHLPEAWQKYLSKTGEHSMQHFIQLAASQIPAWGHLPEFIKSGKPTHNIMDMLTKEPEGMRSFIDGMHSKGLKAVELIAREIPVGEARHMLDLGGGPGTFTLEWAKQNKNLKGTVFDLPSVLEITKEYIKQYNLEDRVNTKAGDFNKDDLGSGYDQVLLASILHMYDSDASKALIKKAVESLIPGGRIIIHGFCTDDDETVPIGDSMFSLGIAMSTEGGTAHSIRQISHWLEEAGISGIHHFRIQATPTAVITGTKTK